MFKYLYSTHKKSINYVLVFVFSLAFFLFWGGLGKLYAQSGNIVNVITDKHVYVRESKVSIIPPEGAQQASNFVGLTLANHVGAIYLSSAPLSLDSFKTVLASEQKKNQGFSLLKSETLKINNLPAQLYLSTFLLNGFKMDQYHLLILTAKETIILNAHFKPDIPGLAEDVRKSLLTVVYDAKKEVDHMEVLPFKVTTAGTRFKLAKTTPNAITYSTDGKFPPANRLHSMLIVAPKMLLDFKADKKEFVLNQKNRTGFKWESTAFINEITIDELPGFEVYFKGKGTSDGLLVYYYDVYLFSPSGRLYNISGITADPTNKTLEEFKKIARTFQRF